MRWRILDRIRQRVSDPVIRTSFIVGFPGESQAAFDNLCRFVEDVRFDRLAVFRYSREEGSGAAELADQVPEEVAEERRDILLDIQEVKKPDLVAQLVAESVSLQLERRISFRRAIKKAVQTTMSLGAKGVRLQVGGRLGGADIARTESARAGSVPLHTLRANIDYGFTEARTVYGKIGIKCWICLEDDEKALS